MEKYGSPVEKLITMNDCNIQMTTQSLTCGWQVSIIMCYTSLHLSKNWRTQQIKGYWAKVNGWIEISAIVFWTNVCWVKVYLAKRFGRIEETLLLYAIPQYP